MAIDARVLKPSGNAVILDAIRNEGSNEYRYRIPSATQAGVEQTVKSLLEYRGHYNEFVDALVNRIGLVVQRSKSWANPLGIFKRGMLEFGDTIEEIQVGLINARNYDPDREEMEKSIFGTYRPEVQANFHSVNRQDYYPMTVNEPQLRRAFLNENGLYSFANDLLDAPGKSDQWDEFLLTCQLFQEYEANGGYFKVNVPDLSLTSATDKDAKTILKKVRSYAKTLTFLSRRYNAAGMPTFVSPEDLYLFTTPDVSAALDVDALAAAFNIDKASVPAHIIEIPKERFGIDGVQAILTTRDFFVMADQRYETTSAVNPVALQSNYFLHHWQVISVSRFAPAIMFWTGASDEVVNIISKVTAINSVKAYDVSNTDVTATGVNRGGIYAMVADAVVTYTGGTGTGGDAVDWTVTGANSTKTYITNAGVLHVSGTETANTLTVKATAAGHDPASPATDGVSRTVTLNVLGSMAPVWPLGAPVTGITVKGTNVSPAFAPGTTAYTVPTALKPVVAGDVKVAGPNAGDVKVTVSADGNTITVSSPTSPNDPVYTITFI